MEEVFVLSKFTRIMICFFTVFVVLCALIAFFFRKKDEPVQTSAAQIVLPEIPAGVSLENAASVKKTMLRYQLYFTPYMKQIANLPEFESSNELTDFDKLAFAVINSSGGDYNSESGRVSGGRLRQIVSRCLGAELHAGGGGSVEYDSSADEYIWLGSPLRANSHALVFSDIEQNGAIFKAYFLAYQGGADFDYTAAILSPNPAVKPAYMQTVTFSAEYDEEKALFLRYHSNRVSSVM